ncbi:MAG TPA: response regulator transcription factor [Candidatus Dormibacteraeota bacterium]|nr:response regulator transcription factor [Candidatus Dormibacteraeota bacterium]
MVQPPSPQPPPARGVRVLLIEDEVALGHLVERVLREEGFQVLYERTGDGGLETALQVGPEAVILDLSLPGMDGLEVCRALRSHDQLMPIIVLTARDAVRDRVSGLDAGADDYVTKPFAIEELLARLRARLRREEGREEGLQVADLRLEPATRIVRRGGREIELTPHEFSLLELLMRHPGQVLTRQRILDHVWGYDVTPSSNVVDIYIHYLRDKIDRDHPHKLIRTVRSVGYALGP